MVLHTCTGNRQTCIVYVDQSMDPVSHKEIEEVSRWLQFVASLLLKTSSWQ